MNQLLDEILNSIKTTVLDNSVGVAFSGGVDSTLIAKLLDDNGYDIHLLTIGFPDSHDINFAKEVNEILKLFHTKPLFGTVTKKGVNNTYFFTFMKIE